MGLSVRARLGRAARRSIDLLGGTILLLLLSPVLAAGALLVLIDSGRPMFFGHQRVGQGGRPFRCWKLRTMRNGAEHHLNGDRDLRRRYVQNGYKIPVGEDPRVTPIGRLLRRFYVDEIPQLVNVLNGTMSLVGPRPVVAEELGEWNGRASELLQTRPGLTGAWTSRGRERPPYPERADLELEYVRSRTLKADLAILARTVAVVLQGQE